MTTDNRTVADQAVTCDQCGQPTGEAVRGSDDLLKIVFKYFSNLDCCVEEYGDDFGMTKPDAIAQLAHDLDPHYIDWGNGHDY